MTLFLSSQSVYAVNLCSWLFHKKPVAVALPLKKNAEEITDLKSFGLAMTEGMNLNPGQTDLFEIYRQIFFGNPITDVKQYNLDSVFEFLKKHPELQKVPFSEMNISSQNKIYETPENLSKYLKSQFQTSGQIRSNLLKVEANLGYWKKILDYQEPLPPEGLSKNEIKNWNQNNRAKFEKFLNRIISKTNRKLLEFLQSEDVDYQIKTKILFKTLQTIESWLSKKGRNTQSLRQAMVDLIHTVGFGNQATLVLLKSKNGLDKIEGLKKILDERDNVAMSLGFEGHFQELQQKMMIDFPTGLSKNESPYHNIEKLEQEVLRGPFENQNTEALRVRSLSLQESPFRSCLGGSDCSTRTYFSKALDPNYYYFTMTDSDSHSSGHVTVVLGEAKNKLTQDIEKVAFVDKVQNVPNHLMIVFFKAVSMSLKERGYLLAIPTDLGGHNGISNMESISNYIKNDVLSKLKNTYLKFKPEPHDYNFKNSFSRANDGLSVKIFDSQYFELKSKIEPGKKYVSSLAPKDLNKENLVSSFIKLRESSDPQDKLSYISSYSVVNELIKYKLFSKEAFESDLEMFIKDTHNSFNIRKHAAMTLIVSQGTINNWVHILEKFNELERHQIISDIQQWSHTNEHFKKKFYNHLLMNISNFYTFYYEDQPENKNDNPTFHDFYNLVAESLKIAHSQNLEDQYYYLRNPNMADALYFASFNEEGDFKEYIQNILKNSNYPIELRLEAILASILQSSKNEFEVSNLKESDYVAIKETLSKWKKSSDPKYKEFFHKLSVKIDEFIAGSNLAELKSFEKLKLFNVNDLNIGGFPYILVAIHHQQTEIVNWMLSHPEIDLKSWQRNGFNVLEQARRFGNHNFVDQIELEHPELNTKNIKTISFGLSNTPIVNFVKIPSGSFEHYNYGSHSIRIQAPIEMMSVMTSQKLWYDVIQIGKDKTNLLKYINSKPSAEFDFNKPVNQVSYVLVRSWLEDLNILSKLDDEEVQIKLSEILPGHQKGDFYGLPTEEEWIYVSRLEGLVSGSYLFGFKFNNMDEFGLTSANYKLVNKNKFLIKPVFINGEPFYDLFGKIASWMASGEVAQRPHDKRFRVFEKNDRAAIKGGYFAMRDSYTFSSLNVESKEYKNELVGFRLIRVKARDMEQYQPEINQNEK